MAESTASVKPVRDLVRPGRGQCGFTMLELTVVMALLVLMMGMVVPNLYGSWQRERDRAAVRQLMTTMRTARSLAATRHRRVRVFLDLAQGRYQLEGSPQTVDVSQNFRLGDAHLVWQDREARRGYVAFYGDGSSSGGYLALVDRGGKIQVMDVEILTGRVSLKSTG
ncbi:MAG: GspH/FimT family pseudopilin [Desulfobaccales bacterium]